MPKFQQVPLQTPFITNDVIQEHMGFISKLNKGHEGVISYENDHIAKIGRIALMLAGEKMKVEVKVRKVHNNSQLKFRAVSIEEKEQEELIKNSNLEIQIPSYW